MAFDIDQTLGKMAAAAMGALTGAGPKVKTCVEQALQAERDALKDIAEARLSNQINDGDMASEIQDEAGALEAALLACQVETKAVAQQAANAAVRVLSEAINAALKIA